ncbi:hypothetical protein C3L33_21544, partial [Rhododendron williamsianum]
MAMSILNGTYVNNRDQVYGFYTPINASTLLRWFVDELGSSKLQTWVGKWVEFYSVPGDQCATYSRCGAYGYCDSNNRQDFECTCLPGYEPRSAEEWYLRDASGGCIKERKALSMCGNGEGFVKVVNTNIPDTSKARLLTSLSVNECKDECLRNCSCLAYASEVEGGERANCITWSFWSTVRIVGGGYWCIDSLTAYLVFYSKQRWAELKVSIGMAFARH